jgi:hypothetical protein
MYTTPSIVRIFLADCVAAETNGHQSEKVSFIVLLDWSRDLLQVKSLCKAVSRNNLRI